LLPNFEPTRLFDTLQDMHTPAAGTGAPEAPAIPQLTQVAPTNGGVGQPQPAQPHQPAQQRQHEPAPHPSSVQLPHRRFQTPAGHFPNRVDNMLAATHNLAALSINGNTPIEIEARRATRC
jgi:hypothetical protein